MKTTEVDARVNGVHLTEITVKINPSLSAASPSQAEMVATYALVEYRERDPKNPGIGGRKFTHGKCHAYGLNWSKGTMELLGQLIASMESDLLPRHFVEAVEGEHAKGTGHNDDESADQI